MYYWFLKKSQCTYFVFLSTFKCLIAVCDWDLLFRFLCSFYRQKVFVAFERVQTATILLPLSCDGQLQQQERPLLGLVFFKVLHPFPCTTCFMLPMMMTMGLSPRLLDFSS